MKLFSVILSEVELEATLEAFAGKEEFLSVIARLHEAKEDYEKNTLRVYIFKEKTGNFSKVCSCQRNELVSFLSKKLKIKAEDEGSGIAIDRTCNVLEKNGTTEVYVFIDPYTKKLYNDKVACVYSTEEQAREEYQSSKSQI